MASHSFALPGSLALCFLLTACGGGGGSGGGFNVPSSDPGVQSDGSGTPSSVPLNASLTAASCAVELDSSRDLDSIEVQNTTAACDYFVSRDQVVSSDIVIPAGTTFLMDESVSIRFEGDTTRMDGTSGAPITFQRASAESGAWGQLRFNETALTASYLRATGGGNPDATSGAAEAIVQFSRGELDLVSSEFVNSATSGLELGFTVTLNRFSNNRMAGNTDFGLIVKSDDTLNQLPAGSDYTGGDTPNGSSAIFADFNSASNLVLQDLGAPYLFEGLNASDLLVRDGTQLWFTSGTGLAARGSFHVQGTEARPVVFSGTPGMETIWGGIDVAAQIVRMDEFDVLGGGLGQGGGGGSLSFTSSNSDTRIRSGRITDSQGFAVFCPNSSFTRGNLVIEDLSISNSLAGDIHPQCDDTLNETIAPSGLAAPEPVIAINDAFSECNEALLVSDLPGILRNGTSDCDYYVRGIAEVSGNFVIEPGTVIVMADGARMRMSRSTLTANGEADNPIVFQGETAERGAWRGIDIQDSLGSQLSNVILQGAGDWEFPALQFSRATGEVQSTTIEGSDSHGLLIPDRATLGAFQNNRFASNTRTGLKVDTSQIERLDTGTDYNPIDAPNGIPGIEVFGLSAGDDESDVFADYGAPWYIDVSLRIDSGFGNALTTFEAGTSVLFGPNATLFTSSPVLFDGTVADPILMSGVDGSTPINNWGSIVVMDEAVFRNVDITGGGSPSNFVGSTDQADDTATLMLRSVSAAATLDNVSIRNGNGWGVSCAFTGTFRPADFVTSNTTFEGNANGAISPECNL